MNIPDSDEFTQPPSLFHLYEFNQTHWLQVRPRIKDIACSNHCSFETSQSIWIRVIAEELRRLKIRQKIAIEMLRNWTQSEILKDHVIRVVNEAYNEFTFLERNVLSKNIINPKINSLPKSSGLLYLKIYKIYKYNQFEASYSDLEKLTGLSYRTVRRSMSLLKQENLLEYFSGVPTKGFRGGIKSVIKLIPPEEFKTN